MRILITGARGFIGKHLYCFIYNNKLSARNILTYDILDGEDILDKWRLNREVEGENIDVMIHLAALPGVRKGEIDFDRFVDVNIKGTQNVIDICKENNIKTLIFFSSSSVLGGSDRQLNEGANYNPRSNYAVTKVTGEMLVKNSGLNYFIVRPFTVYGPGGRPDMVIYRWINQVKRGEDITYYNNSDVEESSRGYTHIDDLVRGVWNLIYRSINVSDFGARYGRIFHIGGDEVYNLSGLLELFKTKIPKDYPIARYMRQDADVQISIADISLAKEALDYKPSTNFKKEILKILNKEL